MQLKKGKKKLCIQLMQARQWKEKWVGARAMITMANDAFVFVDAEHNY